MNPFVEYTNSIDFSKVDKILLIFRGGLVAREEIFPLLDNIPENKEVILCLSGRKEQLLFPHFLHNADKKYDNVKINTFDIVKGKIDMELDIDLENTICIMNPPYKKGIDLKFLSSVIDIGCKEVVCVHPSTYLVDRKQ